MSDIFGNEDNRDTYGNPMDRDIHGNRPSDVHGSLLGGNPAIGPPNPDLGTTSKGEPSTLRFPDDDSDSEKTPVVRPSGGPGLDLVPILSQSLRLKSLFVWAVVFAIFYYTPIVRLAKYFSIWTPLFFAIPLIALVITSRTARPTARGLLVLVVVGSGFMFWWMGRVSPGWNFFPSIWTETGRREELIDRELSRCKQRFEGRPENAALSCYQVATREIEAELDRVRASILQRLNDGPKGKRLFLTQDHLWQDQLTQSLNRLGKREARNQMKELMLAKERLRADLEHLNNLAVGLDHLPQR